MRHYVRMRHYVSELAVVLLDGLVEIIDGRCRSTEKLLYPPHEGFQVTESGGCHRLPSNKNVWGNHTGPVKKL